MRRHGRPVLGAIAGLFFGVFLAFDLLAFKAVASDSPLLLVLPVAMLIVGIVLGVWAPLRRGPAPLAPATPAAPTTD
ncbi:MAG: hypothetical protein QOK43_2580 [Acidimicrobiaceae bacterium]|nr:hypothetical protein [Acidimicrobiaceae bacterium]